MKKFKWLATCGAVALLGSLIMADLGWAQGGGYGWRGRGGQGSQGGGPGRGPGNVNCPNYVDSGYRAQDRVSDAQAPRRARRRDRANCPYYPNQPKGAAPITQ